MKARDSHNLSLEEQLVSPLSYTHCHLQARKPVTKPGTNPICVFYSSTEYFSAWLISLSTGIYLCQEKHCCSIYGVNVHTNMDSGKEVIPLHNLEIYF